MNVSTTILRTKIREAISMKALVRPIMRSIGAYGDSNTRGIILAAMAITPTGMAIKVKKPTIVWK